MRERRRELAGFVEPDGVIGPMPQWPKVAALCGQTSHPVMIRQRIVGSVVIQGDVLHQ